MGTAWEITVALFYALSAFQGDFSSFVRGKFRAKESRRLSGTHLPDEHKYQLTIHGREISQREMLDMCHVRYYQGLGPKYPVEKISYLFIDERVARTYLHELWLRELECWAFAWESGEIYRLDADYHPVPEPPEWVKRVEERGRVSV